MKPVETNLPRKEIAIAALSQVTCLINIFFHAEFVKKFPPHSLVPPRYVVWVVRFPVSCAESNFLPDCIAGAQVTNSAQSAESQPGNCRWRLIAYQAITQWISKFHLLVRGIFSYFQSVRHALAFHGTSLAPLENCLMIVCLRRFAFTQVWTYSWPSSSCYFSSQTPLLLQPAPYRW